MSQAGNGPAAQAMFLRNESDACAGDHGLDDDCMRSGISSLSIEDRRVLFSMEQWVEFVHGHYQVPLPWKYNYQIRPNNLDMAKKR